MTSQATTKELLAQLNALRVRAGKTELAAWKSSREKLESQIADLTDELGDLEPDEVVDQTDPTMPMGENGNSLVDPLDEPSDLSDPEVGQTEVKIPRGAINAMCVELLQTDMPYEDIVAAIRERYPTAKTTARSLASVAMDLRVDGLTVPTRRKPAAAKPAKTEGEA